jgi:hypothetical protein
MTREEKFKVIVEKLKEKVIDFDPAHISAMAIIGYLDDLSKYDLVQSAYEITESGKTLKAICEEVNWTPDDDEIKAFVLSMVEKNEQSALAYLIMRYRDDRENLLKEVTEYKKSKGEEPGKI